MTRYYRDFFTSSVDVMYRHVLHTVLAFAAIGFSTSLEHGNLLRAFIGVAAFALAWKYSAYPYNFFFDQAHGADRLLVWVMFALLLWRPVFVIGFLVVVLPIVWQFNQPLERFMWTVPLLLSRILIAFFVTWLSLAATRSRKADDFVFLALCLVAAGYWWPGLGKLAIDALYARNRHVD